MSCSLYQQKLLWIAERKMRPTSLDRSKKLRDIILKHEPSIHSAIKVEELLMHLNKVFTLSEREGITEQKKESEKKKKFFNEFVRKMSAENFFIFIVALQQCKLKDLADTLKHGIFLDYFSLI